MTREEYIIFVYSLFGNATGNFAILHIVGFPQFYFIPFGVHYVNELAVAHHFHFIGYGNAIGPQLLYQFFQVRHPVVDHKLFGGWLKVFGFLRERAPLGIAIFGTVGPLVPGKYGTVLIGI